MKKMQCEVCGSVDIKKLDDKTFECQSCGIQYDITEFENTIDESDTVQESETSVDEKTIDKYNCNVEFQSFVKDSKDKILISPTKADLEKYFNKTVSKMPEDCILIIESNISQKRFERIVVCGHPDSTVSINVILDDKEYRTEQLSKLQAWKLICEYAQNGNVENEKINLVKENKPKKGKSTEDWIHYCGIMGLTPYTFILGIVTVFLISKAKKENDGILSKRAKRDVVLGVSGFVLWVGLFILMLSLI